MKSVKSFLLSALFSLLFFNITLASNAGVIDTLYISGNISSNTTWYSYYKVVFVTGNLIVDNGVTLTIEAGVPVKFTGNYYLKVNGTLLAQGSESDSIRFTRDDTTGFSGNDTTGGWRGVRFDGTSSSNDSSIFEYCIFEYGKTFSTGIGGFDNMGAGLFIKDFDKVRVENCVIRNNKAQSYAGGMRIHNANVRVINTKITGNYSDFNGGGIYVYTSDNLQMIGCLIADNESKTDGGGLYSNNGNYAVTNCTIVNNNAGQYGDNLFIGGTNQSTYTNCIIWGSSSDQVYLSGTTDDPSFINCDIKGGESGFSGNGSGSEYSGTYSDNIDSDPEFVGSGNDPYSLQTTSPCLNAGTSDTTGLYLAPTDIIGNTRIQESVIDMGAYESAGTSSVEEQAALPFHFQLKQNYPNPFNPSTTLRYELSKAAQVLLTIYNVAGQKVAVLVQGRQAAGAHQVQWNAKGMPSGIYFAELKVSGHQSRLCKMTLLK